VVVQKAVVLTSARESGLSCNESMRTFDGSVGFVIGLAPTFRCLRFTTKKGSASVLVMRSEHSEVAFHRIVNSVEAVRVTLCLM